MDEGDSRLARLGALFVAPRRLARRDLDRRDGKALDDLVLVAALVSVLAGLGSIQTAVAALAAGRVNTALHALVAILRPAAPLALMWLVAAAAFQLFSFGSRGRAVGELAARVTTAFLFVSFSMAPVTHRLAAGELRFALEKAPWAVAALMFGLLLRESFQPQGEGAPAWAPPSSARTVGIAALGFLLVSSGAHALIKLSEPGAERASFARRGEAAPAVDLPLLTAQGARLQLSSLRDRRVILSFWATWCQPCLEELPDLESVYREHAGVDAPVVYAINVDEPGPNRDRQVRAVVSRLGLTMPIALDDGSASRAYSASTIPTLVKIDGAGRLAEVFDRPLDRRGLQDLLRP